MLYRHETQVHDFESSSNPNMCEAQKEESVVSRVKTLQRR